VKRDQGCTVAVEQASFVYMRNFWTERARSMQTQSW